MNNNLGNNENDNNVPKVMPSIPLVERPEDVVEPVQFEQPVSIPSEFPVEEPTVIQEPAQFEQPVSIPSEFPEVEPIVIQEPAQFEQPVSIPSEFLEVEPIVIQEPAQFEQPVSIPSVYPVEQPAAVQQSVQFEQPVSVSNEFTAVETPVMPVQNEQPVVTNETNQIEAPKKNKKGKRALLIILILFTLCLISGGAYYAYSTNEKIIINNSIKQLEGFKDYFQSPLSLKDSDQYSEAGTFNIQMNETNDINTNQIIDLLNSLKFNYNFSKTAEKTLFELNVSDETKELGGVKLLTTSETGYVFLNKIFDKYIEISELKDALSSTNYNDIEDYNYLYDFVVKSFVKNVNKDDFVKDTAEITINGEKKQVNSLKLEYNDKEILELINLVIGDIKADKQANEIVTNIYKDFDSYDMTSSMDAIDAEHMSTYIYTVYTSKLTNVVEGMDFDYKYYDAEYSYDNCYSDTTDDTTDDTTNDTLENMKSTTNEYKVEALADDTITSDNSAEDYTADDYTTYDYSTDGNTADDYTTDDYTTDDYYTTSEYEDCTKVTYNEKTVSIQYRNDTNPRIYVSEDNNTKGFIELVKEDNILTINLYNSDEKKLGFIKINSTKTLYEVTADFTVDQNEYKLTFSTNIEEVTAGEEYNLDSILSYEEYSGTEKTNSITLNVNGTIKTSASIEETTTDSVKYDELTAEQQQQIYDNLMNIIAEKIG